jgi:hypothetical protein
MTGARAVQPATRPSIRATSLCSARWAASQAGQSGAAVSKVALPVAMPAS